MLARSALLRRLSQRATAVRTFHASVLANDALDMADTFARRHSKFDIRTSTTVVAFDHCTVLRFKFGGSIVGGKIESQYGNL